MAPSTKCIRPQQHRRERFIKFQRFLNPKEGKSQKEVVRMAEKVAKAGVKKAKGYLYFVDRHGDVSRAKMARGRKGKRKKRR